ncbi:hypothetical protein FRB94_013753 [Tulasnella sp. JGI-2019a]|nr:hypothetical protein FRB94_013753 [Tulasnella sp. JGI-2019a]
MALLTYDMIVVCGQWGPTFCHNYFFILGGGGFILLFAVQGALQMRVYALYNVNRKLLIFNFVFFLLVAITIVTLFILDTSGYRPTTTPPCLTGCWSTTIGQNYTRYIWWLCLTYESWLSFLVMRKAYQDYREFDIKSPVLIVLVRDSLVYFLLLGGCLLWMGLAFAIAPPGLLLLGVPFTHASATIGGSRLLLNLRSAHFGSNQQDSLISNEGGGDPWKPSPNAPRYGAKAVDTLVSGENTIWGTGTVQDGTKDDYGFGEDGTEMKKRSSGDHRATMNDGRDLSRRSSSKIDAAEHPVGWRQSRSLPRQNGGQRQSKDDHAQDWERSVDMARHRKQRWSDDNRVHLNRGNQDRASEPAGAAGEYLDRRQRQHGRWRLCSTDYIQGRHPSGGWAAYGGGLLADGNATAELGPVSHWESSSGILRLRNEDPGAHTFEKEGEELNAGDREVVSRDRRSQQSMKRGTLGDKDGLSLQ